MRLRPARGALALLLGAGILSCSNDVNQPRLQSPTPTARAATAGIAPPQVVISQVYGGGGNSGATYRNDFIELHNTTSSPVTVDGWSVQYASSAGTSWAVTPISGTIPAGGYYLVQEAKGSGGTTDLPTPEASGSLAMSASDGKVLVVASAAALSGICPASAMDQVSFGGAQGCSAPKVAKLSNANAAIRNDNGCAYTPDLSLDFTVTAPAPRNGASTAHVCQTLTVGPLDHVVITGPATVNAGTAIQLGAIAQDANNQPVGTATITWTSSDEQVATVDATGKVTGVSASPTPVTITATATDNGTTKSADWAVTVNPPGVGWVDVGTSTASMPPGFQSQLFLTARAFDGGPVIPAGYSVVSLDPAIAQVLTIGAGTFVQGLSAAVNTKPGLQITATPLSGGAAYSFVSHAITIEAPDPVNPALYATNDEFGDPTPASSSNPNDLLITRPQYTISYNELRGTPNWVSYEVDSRQLGPRDRCNCFTPDPAIPVAKQIFYNDYTNGGYDRGHMAPSADRTVGNMDNAATFYLSNILPQRGDLNQGVWESLEQALRDSARAGRAVYVIAGPLYNQGQPLTFLKNEGKIAVPDATWKIALIGPRQGSAPFTRASIQGWTDLDGITVLAVNMPNIDGVRNDPWSKYLTTIDRIEAATGYDFLSLLPAAFQDAVEAGDHAPVARFSASASPQEGIPVTFDASASSDADIGRTDMGRTEALAYTWHFSDGGTASGSVATHAFTDNGSYTATLTVTDAFGWEETTSQPVSVANVAPAVTLAATSPISIFSGDHFAVTGGFADPGADAPWHAVLAWGNGSTSPSTWSAPGGVIADSSVFLGSGSYTVTLTVTDKDGAAGSASVALDVLRRPVPGSALPNSIAAAETDGDIMVTLASAPLADVSTLDLRSVTIAGVGLSAGKKVKSKDSAKDGSTVTLRFARKDLIDAGVLTPATTELVVSGDLTGGVQIISHVPVSVH